MFVDNGLLHSGGSEAYRAGEHAHRAANHLAVGWLTSRMFGDFAAAEALHEATITTRERHQRTLLAHKQTLGAVGAKAHLSATSFADMEDGNAIRIQAVRCASAT